MTATPGEVEPGLQPLSLKANFLWTFPANVVYAVCQWGVLMVLAKLGTPEMVGKFALGLAVSGPVILLANLSLRSVQATDAHRQYLFSDYLGLRLITSLLAVLVIASVGLVGYRGETALVVALVGMAQGVTSISDVFYGLLQQHERMDRIAKSMMIKGPLSLVALGTTVSLTHSVAWGAAAMLAAWTAVLLAYDLPSGALLLRSLRCSSSEQSLRPRWHWPTLLRLAWLSLPVGLVMMLISANINVPRYFIAHYLGERALGIYAAMAYLMVAGTTVVNALGQSASPRLSRQYADRQALAFRALLSRLLAIGAALGIGGVLLAACAGRPLLTVLYRPEYAQHTNAFVLLAVAGGTNYLASFCGYALTAARAFRVQPLVVGIAVLTNASLCLLLVPRWGLWGAAGATAGASLVHLLGFGFFVTLYIRRLRVLPPAPAAPAP